MAKNYTAYEAAKVIMENKSKEELTEVGSRFPLFAHAVATGDMISILKAVNDKISARVVETGLKESGEDEEQEEEQSKKSEKAEAKKAGKGGATKTAKKQETEEEEEETTDYDSMTSKALYALCCERGISSQCKKRDKASLIAVLKANDGSGSEEEEDWEDEEEQEESDPYVGKSAKELYKMCKDRGIQVAPKKDASVYAEALRKADAETDEEDDDDDSDDWEI